MKKLNLLSVVILSLNSLSALATLGEELEVSAVQRSGGASLERKVTYDVYPEFLKYGEIFDLARFYRCSKTTSGTPLLKKLVFHNKNYEQFWSGFRTILSSEYPFISDQYFSRVRQRFLAQTPRFYKAFIEESRLFQKIENYFFIYPFLHINSMLNTIRSDNIEFSKDFQKYAEAFDNRSSESTDPELQEFKNLLNLWCCFGDISLSPQQPFFHLKSFISKHPQKIKFSMKAYEEFFSRVRDSDIYNKAGIFIGNLDDKNKDLKMSLYLVLARNFSLVNFGNLSESWVFSQNFMEILHEEHPYSEEMRQSYRDLCQFIFDCDSCNFFDRVKASECLQKLDLRSDSEFYLKELCFKILLNPRSDIKTISDIFGSCDGGYSLGLLGKYRDFLLKIQNDPRYMSDVRAEFKKILEHVLADEF